MIACWYRRLPVRLGSAIEDRDKLLRARVVQADTDVDEVVRHVPARQGAAGISISCTRRRVFALGMAALFAVAAGDVAKAQTQTQDLPAWVRLTVRPRAMPIAAESPPAGEYLLDSLSNAIVTVPPQCAGAHRCPLFFQLPGGDMHARQMTDWLGPVANKYGMILLTTTDNDESLPRFDAALKEVLHRFAIEPSKIAIAGRCASGPAAAVFGAANQDVFSRIVVVSGGGATRNEGTGPEDTTVEYLVIQDFRYVASLFENARLMRRTGHPVKLAAALRGHEHQAEDYDFVGHWLQESWAKPDPAIRPAPVVVADPLPRLTPQAVRRLTTFWAAFLREPDSIRVAARRAHLREVAVPVGAERPSVWMTDMAALAAKYPSVAADLKHAGLTAQQHDAYRVALISAQAIKVGVIGQGRSPGPDLSAVEVKNLTFLDTYADELDALAMAGVAKPDAVRHIEQTMTVKHPAEADGYGPLGIWRTP